MLPNVLEMIGNTPMVRLDKIAKEAGLECDLRKTNGIPIVAKVVTINYVPFSGEM